MKFKFVPYLLTLAGLIALLFAMNSYMWTSELLGNAITAKGEVVALERPTGSEYFKPRIRFSDNHASAIEFTANVGSNPPAYSVGDQVEVIFSERGEHMPRINSFFSLWGSTLIMSAIGSVLLIPSVGFIVFRRREARHNHYLRQHGLVVEADFQSVERNHRLTVNGRNPFVVVCNWRNPATSELHRLESENIWYDPSAYISATQVRVFIDQRNPRKYHMDLSFLPKLAD